MIPELGQTIRVLTLTQPWATLVAIGAKRIETRSWGTDYRGPLAIHAAGKWSRWDRDLCYTTPFFEALKGVYPQLAESAEPKMLPTGCIVAVGRLRSVVRIDESRTERYGWLPGFGDGADTSSWTVPPPEPERSFGFYHTGRRAWLLDEVSALQTPIPHKGAQGLRSFVWNQNIPSVPG